MSNRFYRLLFGIALLVSLYFDLHTVIYGLIALALFEAANQRAHSAHGFQAENRQ